MKQAIIVQENDKIAIQSPFDRSFLDELKEAIPSDARKWNAASKQWLVGAQYAEVAIKVARQYFDVVDGREKTSAEIEEAQIDSELAEIKANQQAVLRDEARIDAILSELDAQIGRYSPRSVSSVKAELARERALLARSLDNAQQPAETLTELQVRGLAAAVRYLDK